MNSTSTQLLDRAEIIELINWFGLAIDLRDWDRFHSLFADTVDFDYSSIGEVAGTFPPDDITRTAQKDLGGFRATQHVITNHCIDLDGDVATCYAHVRAQHFLPNDRGESLLEIGGYYTGGLVRQAAGWKIRHWTFSALWTRGDRALFSLVKVGEETTVDRNV